MKIQFHKYQGTGNDFIMIDQRKTTYIPTDAIKLIENLCNRRYGIGADGLILLENAKNSDFRMVYFNADGREGSMCGNGGRCIVSFAKSLDIFQSKTVFDAIDGIHYGNVMENGTISIKMKDVDELKTIDNEVFELNTGSPHFVRYVAALPHDVKSAGAAIRYSNKYKDEGINVNFVFEKDKNQLFVATYERGVEDETYSCGTGVTASALCYAHKHNLIGKNKIYTSMKGGDLMVSFNVESSFKFADIWLTGPAQKVFEGTINL